MNIICVKDIINESINIDYTYTHDAPKQCNQNKLPMR